MNREKANAAAIAVIDLQIGTRHSQIAALERARDVLERKYIDAPEQCDLGTEDDPCFGVIYARCCSNCGEVIRRCDQHGGLRSATMANSGHRRLRCPSGDACDPQATHTG